jgi:hypothetical protein
MYVQGIHVSRIHAIGIMSIEREGRSSRVKEKHHVAIQIPEMSHTGYTLERKEKGNSK